MATKNMKQLPVDWDEGDIVLRVKYQLRTGDLKRRAYQKVRDEVNQMAGENAYQEKDIKEIFQGPR